MGDEDALAELDGQFDEVSAPEVTDYSALSYVDLVNEFHRIRQALLDIGEMLSPRTAAGRELHSQRGAVMVALANRKGFR